MAQRSDHDPRVTPEGRRFLEALVFWRGLYGARGPRDRQGVETIDAVIAEAERQMRALRMTASA